jgi:PAS domain S-box-containing protein
MGTRRRLLAPPLPPSPDADHSSTWTKPHSALPWIVVAATGLALFLATGLGLKLATMRGTVSAVWPATGVALWLMVRHGPRVWPGLFAGTAFAEWGVGGFSVLQSVALGGGNTLEAVLGYLIWTWAGRRISSRWREPVAVGLVSAVAPLASAGTGILVFGFADGWSGSLQIGATWWLGDAIGALLVWPMLMAAPEAVRVWRTGRQRAAVQAMVLLAALVGVSWLAFVADGGAGFLFSIFPVMLLAAVWFGAPGARATALLFAVAGITAEFQGLGMFRGGDVHGNLLNLHIFLASVGTAALLLPSMVPRGGLLLPAGVLLIGWLLSGWIYAELHSENRDRQERLFERRVDEAKQAIRLSLDGYASVLADSAGFMTAAKDVSRADWTAFARALKLGERFPGINGLGVVFPVSASDAPGWAERMRADGAPQFEIVPFPATTAQAGDVRYVITFSEPQPRNRVSIGRDIATDPSRRRAAEQARDSGELRMNQRIPGSRDAQRRSGFILYVPFYARDAAIATVAERQSAHRGWVYAQCFVDNVLERTMAPFQGELELHFFEPGGLTTQQLLFATGQNRVASGAEAARLADRLPAFSRVTALPFGGQTFQLGWRRGPRYPEGPTSNLAWVAGSFTLATLLLAGLVLNLQAAGMRTQTVVEARTAELQATQRELTVVNRLQRAVLDGTSLSVIATERDGLIREFNVGAERMLGYSRAEMVGIRKPDTLHLAGELEARAAELSPRLGRPLEPGFEVLVAVARDGEPEEREWTFRRKDGTTLPVRLNVTALRNEAGQVTGFLGIARDIRQELLAAASLRSYQERLETIFSTVADAIVLQNQTGAIVEHNAAAERMLGLTHAQLVGQDAIDPRWGYVREDHSPLPPSEHPAAVALRTGRANEGIVVGVHKPDGQVTWMSVSARPLIDSSGAAALVVSSYSDITELRRAARALAEEEAKLRLALEEMPVGLRWVREQDGRREILLNPAHERITGVARAESDLPGIYLSRTHPDDVAAQEAGMDRLRRGEISHFSIEKRFVQRGGGVRWVHVTWFRRQLPGAGNYEELSTVTDTTERRLLEESLARARDQAVEASRLKSEFLATMSHEIRTPMNAIIGMAELLAETPLDGTQQGMLRTIAGGAEGLLAIVNDILDFSRIEAGRIRLDEVDFLLGPVVEDTVALLRTRAGEKGLVLRCDVTGAPAYHLRGDGGRVRQVLLNLLGNAIKFTEAGVVAVNVMTLRETPGRVLIQVQVRDTGIGIPAEARDRLFMPFVQVDGSHTRRFGGTGLGLAISRQLVAAMGGELGFSSEVGRGSEFWFRLELPRAVPVAPETPVAMERPAVKRALVVDANEARRAILLGQVARCGWEGEGVADGPAAIERLRRTDHPAIAVLLIDRSTPGASGDDWTHALRKDPALALLPLVGLGAAGQSGTDDPAAKEFAGWLGLPVDEAELARCLARLLTPPAEAGPGSASVPIAAPARSLRLLVVEDNAANRRVISLLLAKLGHTVELAENGLDGVERLARGTFDAVLMDCQMPDLDGFEAARRVRSGELPGVDPRVPIIAVTAYARADDRERCLAAGMNDHLA